MQASEVLTGHSRYCAAEGRRSKFVFQKGELEPGLLEYLKRCPDVNHSPSELGKRTKQSMMEVANKTTKAQRGPFWMGREERGGSEAEGWVLSVSQAMDSKHGETISLRAMRDPADQPYHPANTQLSAFASALRKVNQSMLLELDERFRAHAPISGANSFKVKGCGVANPSKLAEAAGVHEGAFAIVETQQIWGEENHGGDHMDGVASVLHLAMGLQVSRLKAVLKHPHQPRVTHNGFGQTLHSAACLVPNRIGSQKRCVTQPPTYTYRERGSCSTGPAPSRARI